MSLKINIFPAHLLDDLPLLESYAPLSLAGLGQVVRGHVHLLLVVRNIEHLAGTEIERELNPGALLHVIDEGDVRHSIAISVPPHCIRSRQPENAQMCL